MCDSRRNGCFYASCIFLILFSIPTILLGCINLYNYTNSAARVPLIWFTYMSNFGGAQLPLCSNNVLFNLFLLSGLLTIPTFVTASIGIWIKSSRSPEGVAFIIIGSISGILTVTAVVLSSLSIYCGIQEYSLYAISDLITVILGFLQVVLLLSVFFWICVESTIERVNIRLENDYNEFFDTDLNTSSNAISQPTDISLSKPITNLPFKALNNVNQDFDLNSSSRNGTPFQIIQGLNPNFKFSFKEPDDKNIIKPMNTPVFYSSLPVFNEQSTSVVEPTVLLNKPNNIHQPQSTTGMVNNKIEHDSSLFEKKELKLCQSNLVQIQQGQHQLPFNCRPAF